MHIRSFTCVYPDLNAATWEAVMALGKQEARAMANWARNGWERVTFRNGREDETCKRDNFLSQPI